MKCNDKTLFWILYGPLMAIVAVYFTIVLVLEVLNWAKETSLGPFSIPITNRTSSADSAQSKSRIDLDWD